MKFPGICFAVVLIFSSSLETSSLDSGEICQTPENANGTCLGIRECSYFADQLTKKPIPQSILSTLKKSVCGNANEKPLICCPSDTQFYPLTTEPSSATDVENLNGKKGDRCKTPFDEHGKCIPIRECPFLTDLFQDKDSSTIALNVELITRSRCGMLSTATLYCCPNLLDQSNCGSAISSKFPEDHGNKTEVFDFPWLALISYKPRDTFNCAGSIINSRYILTAAHCVSKLSSSTIQPDYVRLGEYNLETEKDCKGDICAAPPQDIPIEKIIAHPSFQVGGNHESDIALLRLSKDADFSNSVRPVCLPIGLSHPTEDFDGKIFLSTATTRRKVVFTKNIVKGISADKCTKLIENKVQISPVSQLCTVPDKGDDCLSVSGCPLLHYETDKGRDKAIQYGIISLGLSQCGTDSPTVYTNVNHFIDWIIDTVEA